MLLRLTGLLGGLATASALALAGCGGDEKTVETVTDEPGSSRLEKTLSCLGDEGYDADVIALDADPLADIGVLADPDRITGVWARGRQVKGAAGA